MGTRKLEPHHKRKNEKAQRQHHIKVNEQAQVQQEARIYDERPMRSRMPVKRGQGIGYDHN